MQPMHEYTDETEELARAIVAYAREPHRVPAAARPRGRRPRSSIPAGRHDRHARRPRLGGGAAPLGRGARAGHDLHRPPGGARVRPGRPTKARVLFDLIVGASSTIAAGWIDGAGAIWAENQALRWLADLAGLPARGRRRLRVGRLGRATCRRWSPRGTPRPSADGRPARSDGGSPRRDAPTRA